MSLLGVLKGLCCWVGWTISVFDSTLAYVFWHSTWMLMNLVPIWLPLTLCQYDRGNEKQKVYLIIFGAYSSCYYSTQRHGKNAKLFNIPPSVWNKHSPCNELQTAWLSRPIFYDTDHQTICSLRPTVPNKEIHTDMEKMCRVNWWTRDLLGEVSNYV